MDFENLSNTDNKHNFQRLWKSAPLGTLNLETLDVAQLPNRLQTMLVY